MRCRLLVAVTFALPLVAVSWGGLARGDDEEAALTADVDTTIGQLKRLGIAMQLHHDAYKRFPPPAVMSNEGTPLLSWRVKVLQFVEQDELYEQFHLDEPWDSAHNKELIAKMPDIYLCPRSKVGAEGRTVYQLPRGEATAFSGPEGTQIRTISDGLSKTIAIVETDDEHAVIWTKPDDWKLDPENPAAGLGGHFPPNFFVSALDGSVHILPDTIEAQRLRALFTSHGLEAVIFPD